MHKTKLSEPERQRRSRAAQLVSSYPLLRGSLLIRYVRCGKTPCKCASGEGHRAAYLVQSRHGKTRQTYIPKSGEADVEQALENYRRLRELIDELSEFEWTRIKISKG